MRRRVLLRFDIWLSMLLAYVVSLGAVKVTEFIVADTYQDYVAEHTVADGDVGGRAGEDVFRAQSVDDILNHDTFTIVSPGIEFRNRGAGYYDSVYTYAVTLPSGEVVAAQINMENVQYGGSDIYSGDNTLPVGRVVWADLTDSTMFMDQISYGEPLTRWDFYVDMKGNGGKVTQEDYNEHYTGIVQLVTIVVCIPLFHSLGARLGLFPYFIAPKRKEGEQESEWE